MSQLTKKQKELWQGIDLRHLVYATDSFIVFIDKALDLDWMTNDEYEKEYKCDHAKRNVVLNLAAKLETIPNDHQAEAIRINFKRMVGEGIARGLKCDYESAAQILQEAEHYITNRNIETARFWQLVSSILAGTIAATFGLILWIFRTDLLPPLGPTALTLLLCGSGGGSGALLSIIFRMGSTSTTSEAERSLHILEGLGRIIGGALSGILLACLIKAEILLPALNISKDLPLSLVAASIIAGASERCAPSLLSQIEKKLPAKTTEDEQT